MAEWIRIYLDREKLSALSGFIRPSRSRRALQLARKFDIELIFAKVPLSNIIPDPGLDDLIETIYKQQPIRTVSEFVDGLLGKTPNPEFEAGRVLVVEAFEEPKEAVTIIRQDGNRIPLMEGGAYLAYRPPFEKLTLFDGLYHGAFLLHTRRAQVGDQDWVKILIKEHPGTDVANMLDNWDVFHARVTGILGPCPPYNCRTRKVESGYEVSKSSSAVYAICIDVTPPHDMELLERIRTVWRHQ